MSTVFTVELPSHSLRPRRRSNKDIAHASLGPRGGATVPTVLDKDRRVFTRGRTVFTVQRQRSNLRVSQPKLKGQMRKAFTRAGAAIFTACNLSSPPARNHRPFGDITQFSLRTCINIKQFSLPKKPTKAFTLFLTVFIVVAN